MHLEVVRMKGNNICESTGVDALQMFTSFPKTNV